MDNDNNYWDSDLLLYLYTFIIILAELFSICPSSPNVSHLPNTSLVLCLFKYVFYFWEKIHSSLYVVDELAAHFSDFLEVSILLET